MAHSSYFQGVELVGITGTYYADRRDPRFELAVETAEHYQAAGLPLVAVDSTASAPGGDTSWVARELSMRDVTVLPAAVAGIATQRQQGVAWAVAQGAEQLISHEPEKTHMVNFAPQIVAGLASCDILVVGRTLQAEDSLPPVQQRTERLAGWILEAVHGLPADTLSGGRGFTRTGAEYMAAYPATRPGMNNWIYLYDTLLEARAAGRPIGGVAVDLIHLPSMVAQETGNETFDHKRYDQFVLQLRYLLQQKSVPDAAAMIADRVVRTLDTYDEEAVAGFSDSFAQLEADLTASGYQPATRKRS